MHTSAYFSAAIAAVADTDIPAITDTFLVVQNNHFLAQTDRYLYWAAHLSASASRSKLNAADLRTVTNPYLVPVHTALLPGGNPNYADYRSNPLKLSKLEEIACLVTDTAAAHDTFVIITTDQGPAIVPMPAGTIYTLRGTSVTAAVDAAWTQIAMTWQDTLPGGQFVCVGLQHQSTNAIACRLIFPGQQERPGVLSQNAITNQTMFRGQKGPQGVLGRFASTFLPIPEVLVDGVDNAHEVYLDIMRAA